MKRSALALLVFLLFASVSFAQQNDADAPASKADIEHYLDTMHMRDLMKNMMSSLTTQMHKTIHEEVQKYPNLPPDFETRVNKMMDDSFKTISVDELIDTMIPVYQKHLTKGDVDALVAFYSSPRGQKILNEMPAMMSEAMQASSGMMQKVMKDTMQRVQDEIAQAQKADEAKPDDAKSPKQTAPTSN
jgi:uncharacterized protein